MKGKWILVLVLGALALFLCAQAAAQQDVKPSTLYPKVQIVDIERDIINADPQTPTMTRIQALRDKRLQSLIRIRENFRDRVLGSVQAL
jgi:hypothetical protein